jgi:hypothetical protein
VRSAARSGGSHRTKPRTRPIIGTGRPTRRRRSRLTYAVHRGPPVNLVDPPNWVSDRPRAGRPPEGLPRSGPDKLGLRQARRRGLPDAHRAMRRGERAPREPHETGIVRPTAKSRGLCRSGAGVPVEAPVVRGLRRHAVPDLPVLGLEVRLLARLRHQLSLEEGGPPSAASFPRTSSAWLGLGLHGRRCRAWLPYPRDRLLGHRRDPVEHLVGSQVCGTKERGRCLHGRLPGHPAPPDRPSLSSLPCLGGFGSSGPVGPH